MLEELEARERILERVGPGAVTWVPLELSLGQVLAQDIYGLIDSPPFDNSGMDGYAVRASEAQAGSVLQVAGETQAAGGDLGLSLETGGAIRIFTGAAIPHGADAVIMQEDVERDGSEIEIVEGVEPGENIRRQGGDVCAGQKLLNRGDEITPARIGMLASQGIPEIPIHARPMVEIVTTGDELVEPGAPLIPGEIYNSNGPMLMTAAMKAGAIATTSHAMDNKEELAGVLERAFHVSDLVVIAGGVSVGERDFVKEVLNELGVETDFWKVKVKPGKPFLFGRHPEGTLIFGVPGNPVSAFVTFSLFVVPAIRRLLGHEVDPSVAGLGEIRGTAGEAIRNKGDRPHYFRGVCENGVIRLSGTQQSHAIFGLSQANCLVRVEAGSAVEEGVDIVGYAI